MFFMPSCKEVSRLVSESMAEGREAMRAREAELSEQLESQTRPRA